MFELLKNKKYFYKNQTFLKKTLFIIKNTEKI